MNIKQNLKIASYVALAVALIADGWFEQHARGSAEIQFSWLSAWIAAPFLLMGVAVVVTASTRAAKILLVLSILLALSSLLFYWDAMFLHVDAQGALIFLFLPLCQLGVASVVLAGVIIARIRLRLAANKNYATVAEEPK